MNRLYNKKILFLILFLLLAITNVNAKSRYKKIEINGLKIFSDNYLISTLNLKKLSKNKKQFPYVASKINRFYKSRGYTLVITYRISETRNKLIIFVDEGQIGLVKFLHLDVFKTLKLRYQIYMPEKIFNIHLADSELKKIKENYGFKKVYYKLKKSKFYKDDSFQLDNDFDIPYLGKSRFPFFEKFGYRYNIDIIIEKYPSKKEKGFEFNLKTSYSQGLKPYLKYYYPKPFNDKDMLEVYASIGIFYIFDLKPKEKPRWTYMEIGYKYNFTPLFKNFFIPRLSGSVYRSKASRGDIGLSEYEYLKLRGAIEPGFYILSKLKLYLGIGDEKAYIYKSTIDEESDFIVNINENTENWFFAQSSIEIAKYINRFVFQNHHKHYYFKITYAGYNNRFNDKFYQLDIEDEFGFDLTESISYYMEIEAGKIWKTPPFHHEYSVSGFTFKGFMGQEYHSHEIFNITNCFQKSFYKEFFHLGIYGDFTYFKGSGYDLEDRQYGLAYGISAHYIFFDQFEFSVYYGKDYLFSTKESAYNLYLKLQKKW